MNSKDLQKSLPRWFIDFMKSDNDQFNEVIDKFKSKFGKKYDFSKLDIVGFTCVMPVLKDGKVRMLESRGPALVCYIKNTCALIVMGDFRSVVTHSFEFKKETGDAVRVCNNWVATHLLSPKSFENRTKEIVLEGIKENRHHGPEIAKTIEKSADKFVTPFLCYIKSSPKNESEKGIFIHPFGKTTLLCGLEQYIYLISNPSLRFNKSVLGEVKENDYREDVIGATG